MRSTLPAGLAFSALLMFALAMLALVADLPDPVVLLLAAIGWFISFIGLGLFILTGEAARE